MRTIVIEAKTQIILKVDDNAPLEDVLSQLEVTSGDSSADVEDFEIVDYFDNNGPEHFKKFAKIIHDI